MDELDILWQNIIEHQGETFYTMGRGKNHTGSVAFTYQVSQESGASGKHYSGRTVPGYGNELYIVSQSGEQRKNSISRSTVNLAYSKAHGAKGPKALGVPGAGSYLYPIFIRLGYISSDQSTVE